MTNRQKLYTIAPVTALAVLATVTTASAHFGKGGLGSFLSSSPPEQMAERHREMFSQQAELLGLPPETIKNAWAEGKTWKDLLEESGLDQASIEKKMQELANQHMQERLDGLVASGIITQEQADQKLQTMQERIKNGDFPKSMGRLGRGHHMKF